MAALKGWIAAGVLPLALSACTPGTPEPGEPGSVASTPRWVAFNLPQSRVPLPALFVGGQQQLSGGCFDDSVPVATAGVAESIVRDVTREKEFSSELKGAFRKALVEVGVDATMASALMQKVHVAVDSATLAEVDPAAVRPNFKNPRCLEAELRFFEDARSVVTGGLHAKAYDVRIGRVADAEQRLKIDAAVQKLSTDLKFAFRRATSEEDSVAYSARGVYFGGLTSKLVSRSCSGKLEERLEPSQRATRSICDGEYAVQVTASGGADRYEVNVLAPGIGEESGGIDVAGGSVRRAAVGESRIASISVTSGSPDARGRRSVRVEVTVRFVGVSGGEG